MKRISISLRARRPRWWLPLLVAGLLALAYARTLEVPFLYDDLPAIAGNPSIRHLWPPGPVLLPDVPGGVSVAGRPILNLSFAANHALGGTAVRGYHVFSFLVHALAALVLGALVRRTLLRPGASWTLAEDAASEVAAFASLAWALHPLLTQAVTYTVQRAESLMGLFYLVTLLGFSRFAAGGRRAWAAVSVAACALGMGTKEVMATAPLVVLLYDRTFVAGSLRESLRRRPAYYAALAATWIVPVALLATTGGNRGGTVGLGTGVPAWAYPLTQFDAVVRYLALAAWPHPLVFEYGTRWVSQPAAVLPAALLVLALLGATVAGLRSRRPAGFLGAAFFLILAPSSLAPGTIQMVVEHRMYLPLAALATGAAWELHRVLGRHARVAGSLLLAALGLLAYQRNHDYRSAEALWRDTVAKVPQNPRAHDGLALALEERGQVDEAIRHREEAVRLRPDDAIYHYNLGRALAGAGRRNEAIAHYRSALRLDPGEARAHNNLAVLLGQAGDETGALRHYAEAVRLRPRDPAFTYNHGIALLRHGQAGEAAAQFTATLAVAPDHADAHYNLGAALVRLGRAAEAVSHYRAAVATSPQETDYRRGLADALLLSDRPADALAEYRALLERHPKDAEAAYGAGNALAALGQAAPAITHYEQAIRLAPAHANPHFKLGNLLLGAGRISEACVHYEAAVRAAPADAEARHNLGIAYARLERWTEARSAFEAALRLKPDYPEAQRSLARLRDLLGR